MLEHVSDEGQRERRRRADAVVATERQPVQLHREHVDQQQADEEHRNRREDEQRRGQDRVEAAAPPPGADHADERADQERESRSSPRPARASRAASRRSRAAPARSGRHAEVTGKDVPQVLEVARDHALMDVDAELDLQRVQRRRVDVLRKVASTACASLPGITRGMMKLTVSAAHRVIRNRPHRRARYLTVDTAESQLRPRGRRSPGGIKVRQDLTICRGTDTAMAARTDWTASASHRCSSCRTGTSRRPRWSG